MQYFIYISLMMLYDIYILHYFRRMFHARHEGFGYYFAAAAFNLTVTILAYRYLDHRIAVFLMMLSVNIIIYVLFYVNWLQTTYAGSLYIFSLYSSRGIVCSLYSIFLKQSIIQVLSNPVYYMWIFVLSIFLSLLIFQITRKVTVPDSKARPALYNMGQLQFVVVYIIFQLLFLMLVNDGRSYETVQLWFTYLYLGSCVIGKLYLEFAFHHTARVSELIEYELNTNKMKEQLSRQLRHYQSYSRFTESFKLFRHDYEKLMGSVKFLLNQKEYEKAAKMLDDIHVTMKKEVLVHKTYSDHILLDAILQDAANSCEDLEIQFTACACLPSDISASDMDVVCIFSNIVDNAIEACSQLKEEKRFIEITSRGTREWAIIEIVNSFDGTLIESAGELKTRKDNKISHGFGLQIIRRTTESLGGLLYLEPEAEKRIFKIKVCIPRLLQS